MFQNRREAGERLSRRLQQYRDHPQGIVLALPRGGVPLGYQISLRLGLPLNVFLSRKLGAPGNAEFAIGAITETDTLYLDHQTIQALSISNEELQQIIDLQRQEIKRRQILYRRSCRLPSLTKRVALLVDDGIATGATFLASIQSIRDQQPHRLIAAIPVGPPGTLSQLKPLVDELIVLETPEPFFAVGDHYVDFRQVSDDEVRQYLAKAQEVVGEVQRQGSNAPAELG